MSARSRSATRKRRLRDLAHRGIGDERASAMIETAVSLALACTLSFWVFELSLFAYTFAVLNDAAHEGVRYAIAHGIDSSNCSGPSTGCADSTGANVSAVVTTVSGNAFHNISGMTVTVAYPDSSSAPGSLVTVSINYPYVPYFNFPGVEQTANVSAEGRILY